MAIGERSIHGVDLDRVCNGGRVYHQNTEPAAIRPGSLKGSTPGRTEFYRFQQIKADRREATQKPHKRFASTKRINTSRTRRSPHLRYPCNTTFINDGM